ncbi:hypothetical protein [Methylorubrum sp. SB2]|uniref:hypothetical protein n=1 Tax=Methylorubrum subtropicum TaxID=3138812 RepID=UPI00313F1178
MKYFSLYLGDFRGDDRIRLKAFLNDIVQETVSDQELDKLWRSVNDEIYFPEGGHLRAMLKDARDRL